MPATYSIPRTYEHRQRNYIDRGKDIINYDYDNAYPQRVLQVLMSSSTGVACSNLYAKFINGNGFSDPDIQELVVNRKKQTSGQLLKLVSKDYSRFNSFAIHVNYNLNFKIAEFSRIDPRYIRFGLPDTNEYIPKIAIYNDWALDNYKIIKRKEVDFVDIYNPDPEVVRKQVEIAGGIDKYKGQVLYFTGNDQGYPLAPHDSILDDLMIDAKISRHSLTELEKGFMAKHILKLPFEFPNEEDRNKFKADLQAVEGADGDSLFVVEADLDKDSQGLELIKVDHTHTDLKFNNTQENSRKKIYRSYNQPGILHSDHKDSGLSSSDQIKTSFDFYNQHTSDDREMMVGVFKSLFSNLGYEIAGVDELDILERQFITDKKSISEKIGVGSTAALLGVLSTTMPAEQKKEILINVFGVDKLRAELIVDSGDNKIKEDTNADIPDK